ncbi:MAG: 50S ribosomal protein L23 [Candidatus Mycalebacterium zealandia]|nr:MAG: 50S ribosomal protein L23 [Candidatus Mycalebacterium zealandia]
MSSPHKIIQAPLVTEKSFSLREKGWYVFSVDEKSKKHQIKDSVEKAFGVKVRGVRTALMPGKTVKRGGRVSGRKSGYKKAYVKVVEGTIDIFEGT